MKSAILCTISTLACILPILAVEGQLLLGWKVYKEGSSENQGFISTNGSVETLPYFLHYMFNGNNTMGNLFGLFSSGVINASSAATLPEASENQQTENSSEGDILDSETEASLTDKYTWTMVPLTTTETIPESTTETIPETTTETIPETTTETILGNTIEPIPETTTEIFSETTQAITPTTTPTTTLTSTHKTTPTATPTTTTEQADDRPVPSKVDVGPDGLNYFKSMQSLSLTGCRTYCHGFRGYRLAMAKTNETMDALRTHGNVMVDMSIWRNPRTSETKYIWGDGTELDTSLILPDLREPVMNSGRSATVMVMYTSGTNVLLHDAPASYSLPCLCQERTEPTV